MIFPSTYFRRYFSSIARVANHASSPFADLRVLPHTAGRFRLLDRENAAVWKPASYTSGAAAYLVEILAEASVPGGIKAPFSEVAVAHRQ